jgi:1,4-alpha-glucan branching enzyme
MECMGSSSFDAEDSAVRQRSRGAGFRAVPLREAIIYEMHVGTFTAEGTYRAAQQKLAPEKLGVTHVELLPLATFPGSRLGIRRRGLYAPLPAYGTPQELADFIQPATSTGIAVLLDVVYNHLAPTATTSASSDPTSRIATRPGGARRSTTTARTATRCAAS